MKRTKTKILSVFLSVCMVVMCMAGMSVTASALSVEISGPRTVKVGESITLTAQVSDADGSVDYSWTWQPLIGDGDISANGNLGSTYTITGLAPGIVEVELECLDNSGVDFDAIPITVTAPTQPPVAVSPNADAGDVNMDYDSDLDFWICSAVPASGYKFVKWTYYNNNSGQTKESTNDLFYYYTDSYSNVTAVFEADTPTQPPVTVLPNADAGSVNMQYESEFDFWICYPVPATGYHFVKWTYYDNASSQTKESTTSTVYYDTNWHSNLTAVFEADTPAQPTVAIGPDENAGSITYNYNQETSQWELTAVPATGYKFVHWAYFEGEGHAPEPSTSTDETLIVTDDMEDLTAYFEAAAEADEIDISEGTVTVDVSSQSVTVTVDGQIVPASEYHVIFFTYEEIDGGESLTRVGTEFPTAEGTYIAAVIANDDSELYTGENRSEPFTVSGYNPGPTPEPRPTYNIPTYVPPTTTPTTEPEKQTEDIGTFEDITDEEENAGDAGITTPKADLADAVLDANDRAAMAKGSDIKVYLEVEEVKPTAAEKALIDAAVAQIDDDIVVAMFLDIDLFKQVGNGSAVQMHETNGMIEVSIDLPDELKNNDPNVERTYYVVRIHNGEVEFIPCTYDPETGKLSFLTDRFSMYVIAYVDEEVTEGIDADDDDDDEIEGIDADDDDDDEIEIEPGIAEPDDKQPVQDADVSADGETNPHTGAPLAGMGTFAALSFFGAAAAYTIKKRRK